MIIPVYEMLEAVRHRLFESPELGEAYLQMEEEFITDRCTACICGWAAQLYDWADTNEELADKISDGTIVGFNSGGDGGLYGLIYLTETCAALDYLEHRRWLSDPDLDPETSVGIPYDGGDL